MKNKEIFIDISGYEGIYKISNHGRIFICDREIIRRDGKPLRINSKFKSLRKDKDGYLIANLNVNDKQKTFKVHRLVALSFIPNPKNKPQVNHLDGDKTNNCIDNLEWVTCSENHQHAFNTKLRFGVFGKSNNRSKPVYQMDLNDNIIGSYDSICLAEKQTGIHEGSIAKCCRGLRRTAGNFKWKYKTI